MSLITPDLSGIADGAVADASDFTNPLNTIIDDYNGNIDNNNIAATAAIALTKLASTAWTVHSATIGGFSGTPTQAIYYQQIGKTVHLNVDISGTSNATTFTFTLPVAAKRATIHFTGRGVDNGSYVTGPILVTMTAGSTTCTLNTSSAGGAWTAANGKEYEGGFSYEAA